MKHNLNTILKTDNEKVKAFLDGFVYNEEDNTITKTTTLQVTNSDFLETKYIGEETRKAARLKKKQELEKEIEKTKIALANTFEILRNSEEEIKQLKTSQPCDEELKRCIGVLKSTEEHLSNAKIAFEKEQVNLEEKRDKRLNLAWVEGLSKDRSGFADQVLNFKYYKDVLSDIEKEKTSLEQTKTMLASYKDDYQVISSNLDDIQDQIGNHVDTIKKKNIEKNNILEKINELKGSEDLNKITKLKQELEQAESSLQMVKSNIQDLAIKTGIKEGDLARQMDDLNNIKPSHEKFKYSLDTVGEIIESYRKFFKNDDAYPGITKTAFDSQLKVYYPHAEKNGRDVFKEPSDLTKLHSVAKTIISELKQLKDMDLGENINFEDEVVFLQNEIENFDATDVDVNEMIKAAQFAKLEDAHKIAQENVSEAEKMKARMASDHEGQHLKIFAEYLIKDDTETKRYSVYARKDNSQKDYLLELVEDIKKYVEYEMSNSKNGLYDREEIERNIKEFIDPRNWYEFKFQYEKDGSERLPLIPSNYNSWSQGEKGRALLEPIAATLSMIIQEKFKDNAPTVVFMDEAFTGIDTKQTPILINKTLSVFKTMIVTGHNYRAPMHKTNINKATYIHLTKNEETQEVLVTPRVEYNKTIRERVNLDD